MLSWKNFVFTFFALSAVSMTQHAEAASLTITGAECHSADASVSTSIRGLSPIPLDCGAANDANAVNIGNADGAYFELGLPSASSGSIVGGVTVFAFDTTFSGSLYILNAFLGGLNEAANVYYNSINDWNSSILAGTVNNGGGDPGAAVNSVSVTGADYLYIADASVSVFDRAEVSPGGYKLDAVSFMSPSAEVPLPAGALLLLSAGGALAFMRRRSLS